jgi:hypothetical protein
VRRLHRSKSGSPTRFQAKGAQHLTVRVPKYRLHNGSGQALVEIGGRRIYLGKYNSAESGEKYRRLVA